MSYIAMGNAKLLGYEILTIGHPSLRETSKEIKTDQLKSADFILFLKLLKDTLRSSGGVGLAAPQVGVNINLFITRIPSSCEERYHLCKESPLEVWINPSYEPTDLSELGGIEGCLSIPGYVGKVLRPKKIMVDAWNEKGGNNSFELVGWNARVFLHEFDHLKGDLYIDKLAKDNNGKIELYESGLWKTMEDEKKKSSDCDWLRNYGLKSNKV